MNKYDTDLLGKFQAIESFLVSPDNLYGIVGDMIDGMVRPGAYAHIQLNPMLDLTARIDEVKDIQLSGENRSHKLILFRKEDEDLNGFLQAMNVGNEIIEIRISSED